MGTCLVIAVMFGARATLAQAPGTPAPATTPTPAPTPRPQPPTRDPHTPGYVDRQGAARRHGAAAGRGRQFHHRAHPSAGARNDRAGGGAPGRRLQAHDELGRQQDLPGHRARPGDVRHAGSEQSREPDRDHEPSGALHAQRVGLRAEAVRARNGGALHRGRRWPGRAPLHDPRQPDRARSACRS